MQRVAAYAVCVRDGSVLLARWTGREGPEWTLPGGGIDFGEHPRDAAVREVFEETGYHVRLDALLAVDAFRFRVSQHHLRIVYSGTVVGGELTFEIGGSTDQAAWVPLGDVPALKRVPLVDTGLAALAEPGRP